MLIWTIFAVMTGAAVLALLRPLAQAQAGGFADTADAKSLYRAQLAEIDRDLARRLIAPAEAEAARAEAARRLLRAAGDREAQPGETESSIRRRRASSALALSSVPLLALLIYGAYGAPDQPDQPLAQRIAASEAGQDLPMAIARIETHLAKNPGDLRGWALIAPIYMRQGRYDDAVRAFSVATRSGADAEALAGLAEARILAAGGVVTAAARQDLGRALEQDSGNPRARYFLAIAKEQDGDAHAAVADLRKLLADAPEDAEWAGGVRARLSALEAQASGQAIASLPPAERQKAIEGMVANLAERLKQDGGSPADWARLIRAQTVLGDHAAAKQAAMLARQKLAPDAGAVAAIDAVVRDLPKGAQP